jgi:hypothetical protein
VEHERSYPKFGTTAPIKIAREIYSSWLLPLLGNKRRSQKKKEWKMQYVKTLRKPGKDTRGIRVGGRARAAFELQNAE